MVETPAPADAWLRQWKSAGSALAELKRRELSALSEAEALRISDLLLSMSSSWDGLRDRPESSGLVEQQALFHRRPPR